MKEKTTDNDFFLLSDRYICKPLFLSLSFTMSNQHYSFLCSLQNQNEKKNTNKTHLPTPPFITILG